MVYGYIIAQFFQIFWGLKIFKKQKGEGHNILKTDTQHNYMYREKTELFSTKSLVTRDIKILPETLESLARKKEPTEYSK